MPKKQQFDIVKMYRGNNNCLSWFLREIKVLGKFKKHIL